MTTTTEKAMSQSLNADVNQKMSVAFLVEETSTSSAHNVSNHYNNLPSPVLSEAQSSRSSRYSCYSEPPLSSTMRVRSEHEFHPYFSQQEHQRSVARHTAPPLGCSPMSTKQSLRHHHQTSSITALPPPLSETTTTVFHTGLFIKPRPRQYKKKHQISPSHSNQQQQSLLKDDHPPVSSSASCTSTTSSTTSTPSSCCSVVVVVIGSHVSTGKKFHVYVSDLWSIVSAVS
ncbi:hypothetical protein BDR26DRAFT_854335 [Obelidium mucronatum]|nr:hypothetical protein BDR26DRAFT_854335 [Obelidium mucronatum]